MGGVRSCQMAVVAVAFFLSVFSVSAARSRPVKESTVPVSVPRSGLRPPASGAAHAGVKVKPPSLTHPIGRVAAD